VQVFLPAIEAQVNTVAPAIFCESGMKRLVNVTDEVSDEAQCCALLVAWRIRSLQHLHIPRNRFDDTVAEFAVTLLLVCVRVFREVNEVVRVHVRNLASRFVRPRRCVGQCAALREKFFDAFAGSVGELSLGYSSNDLVTLASPAPRERQSPGPSSEGKPKPSWMGTLGAASRRYTRGY
jgi:hypothetical protein